MVTQTKIFFLHAELQKKIAAVCTPIAEPFKIGSGFAEEFKLHLLKFADAEDKITGGNLITERFTDLTDTEGNLFAGGSLNGLEIDKNSLSRFGTQVELAGRVFRNPLEGFEHQVEFADIRKIMTAA